MKDLDMIIGQENKTKVELNSHQRKEVKLFNFESFKEAWQNACLHTRWGQLNPQPFIFIQIALKLFRQAVT